MLYKFKNRNLYIYINQVSNSSDGNPRYEVTPYNGAKDGGNFLENADHKRLCNIFDRIYKTKLKDTSFVFTTASTLTQSISAIEEVLVKMASYTETINF